MDTGAARIINVPLQELDGLLLEQLLELYAIVWGFPPKSHRPSRWARGHLPVHAGLAGFRFRAALKDTRLIGYAYGYTAQEGHWTTDQLVAAMDAETIQQWMEPPPFEVVTLAVHPEFRRQGIGAQLLHDLLANLPHIRGVLWTDRERRNALAFYTHVGWRVISDIAEIEGRRAIILGRELFV